MKKNSTSQPARARRSLWLARLSRRSFSEEGSFKGRRLGEGGFFNLRVLIGVFLVLAGIFFALLGFGTFSNVSAQLNLDPDEQQAGQMKIIRAAHSDLSPPLRDQPLLWPQERQEREPHVHPRLPIEHHDRPDPVIQSSFGQQLMATLAIPAPIRQWAGVGEGECGKPCEGAPPDTNGAVGKAQYVQMVNEGLQV